jgi:nicotinate-nucleotide adenylyltransferase
LRKLGIYGGTFDPVHNAHLILAREALESLELEQVIFVPAAVSPHKHSEDAASAAVRLEMLRVGIADEPGFAIDEQELQRPPPSFTFDTVAAIRAPDATSELFFLIGHDNVAALPSWHRFAELRQLVEFIVLERTASVTEHPYRTIRRHIDISATDIRNRVATGASIRYLVPPAVEEIIHARGLYREHRKSLKKS